MAFCMERHRDASYIFVWEFLFCLKTVLSARFVMIDRYVRSGSGFELSVDDSEMIHLGLYLETNDESFFFNIHYRDGFVNEL